MATIVIHDLNPAGYSLFADNESYLQDLSSDDDLNISGGFSVTSTIACGVSFITVVTYFTYVTMKYLQK
jgi:hypothetical protein